MKLIPVLAILKERKGEFVSGEELAASAGVSRTAIWKQINSLRKTGYRIEASTRSGYRLVSVPDLLLPDEIVWNLGTEIVGREVFHYSEIGSTNEEAKRLAVEGAVDGTVLVAERQTGGRGRLGRGWFSPPGGIWMTVILRPPIPPSHASKITMSAAVSVCGAVKELGIDARIKWPNDVVVDGKKIAGILTEMASEPEMIDHLVVGIGINANISANEFPDHLVGRVTSLSVQSGGQVNRSELVRNLLRNLDSRYLEVLDNSFDRIVREWKSGCETIGQDIVLASQNGRVAGRAVDLDSDGQIVLETADGDSQYFSAGDVSVVKPDARKTVRLRPHHLLCQKGFRGHGYSPEFVEAFREIVKALGDPDTVIEILSGADDLCSSCPHRAGDSCGKPAVKVDTHDATVSRILGIKAGDRITAGEALRKVSEISSEELANICDGCEWLPAGHCVQAFKN